MPARPRYRRPSVSADGLRCGRRAGRRKAPAWVRPRIRLRSNSGRRVEGFGQAVKADAFQPQFFDGFDPLPHPTERFRRCIFLGDRAETRVCGVTDAISIGTGALIARSEAANPVRPADGCAPRLSSLGPSSIAQVILDKRLSQEYDRQGGQGPPAELLSYPSGDCKSLPRRFSADTSRSRDSGSYANS
jgi:hypothetical protein